MRKCFPVLALLIASPVVAQGLAGIPKPAVAPESWELSFRYHDPQRVSVVVPGQSEPVVYWYMLYVVENLTEREVDFYPAFELVTDTLKVVRSDIRVTPEESRRKNGRRRFWRCGYKNLLHPRNLGRNHTHQQ